MDAWGIDVVLTASQKGLGTPPGLSIVIVSQRALNVRRLACFLCLPLIRSAQVFENRSTPVRTYYASWNK